MIVVDIETSGGDFQKCGILQIGALDLFNPENTFLEDARLGEDNEIVNATNLPSDSAKTVEEVLGMTEEDMREESRQSERQLLENFFKWIKTTKIKNFICHNPQFDYGFIWTKANKYGIKVPFHHHAFDTSTIAQIRYQDLNSQFLIKEDYTNMGLKNALTFVGMQDNRNTHNALEDAKLTAECFSRLVYGKNLLEEYKKYPVPEYLKK